MHNKRILMIGAGKLGYPLALHLSEKHSVTVLKRTPFANTDNLSFIYADVSDPDSLSNHLPESINIIVYCLSPGARNEASYRKTYSDGLKNVLENLPANAQPQHLFFVSSTSVYHQDDASWIDENSPTLPNAYSGKILLEAEKVALESGIASTIVRFSGIYGGTRHQLINSVKDGTAKLSQHSRLSNRIHEQDCIGFLQHLIERACHDETPDNLYVASDSAPVDLNEVYQFIADTLDKKLEWSDKPPQRRTGNKKCSNRKMLNSGYCLKYPSYKDGYRESLASTP